MLTYIDKVAKQWGVDRFGIEKMEKVSDKDIETARVIAFNAVSDATKKLGRLPKGTVEDIFCEFIGLVIAGFELADDSEKV